MSSGPWIGLAAAKPNLYTALHNALVAARDVGLGASAGAADASGAQDNSNSDAALEALANGFTDAIHAYFTSAHVNIGMVVSTQPPGVVVVTAGSPFAQIGATVMPILPIHAGYGKLI